MLLFLFFFFLMIRRPPRSTLFPYTTLFRSHLGGDEPMAGFANREVNVRAAERSLECVLDRFDGAEEVLAFGVSYEAAVALEIGVVSAGVAAARVKVGAVGVRLPD